MTLDLDDFYYQKEEAFFPNFKYTCSVPII